ncbi:hypothetical protein FQN49_008883, partial [Arthroderma sp. PD_2]
PSQSPEVAGPSQQSASGPQSQPPERAEAPPEPSAADPAKPDKTDECLQGASSTGPSQPPEGTKANSAPAESSSVDPTQPEKKDEGLAESSSAGPSQPSTSAPQAEATGATHNMSGAVVAGKARSSTAEDPPAKSAPTGQPQSAKRDQPQVDPEQQPAQQPEQQPEQQPAQQPAQQRPQKPRRRVSPRDEPVALTGTDEILPAPPRPEDQLQAQRRRANLPNYFHTRPIGITKLPRHENLRLTVGNWYPDLGPFIEKALNQGFEVIKQKVLRKDDMYRRPRKSPGCKSKCFFSHCTRNRELDQAWPEDRHETPDVLPPDLSEQWYGRTSEHEDAHRPGYATFADMRKYWKDGHTEHLPEYVDGIKVTNVLTWDCTGVSLINWRNTTAEVCWIERSRGLLSSKRIFAVVVVTGIRAYDPATIGRRDSQLPAYNETADSRPKYNYEDVPPEGEAGSSRDANTEPPPIGPTPALGVPEGWLDCM